MSDNPYDSPASEAESFGTPADLTDDVKLWAMLCQLSSLCGLIVPVVGNIAGPLVVWLMKKDEHPFIDVNGKESVNFQLTLLIVSLVAGVPSICVFFIFPPLIILLVIALFAISIAALVFMIIASIKAYSGEPYRYPVSIRFIK